MTPQDDWRSGLTATERYNNVQKIEKTTQHTTLTASAFTLENDAYLSSVSRGDYDDACNLLSKPAGSADVHGSMIELESEDQPNHDREEIQIGSYKHCRYISSGVTADVYRSDSRALKVITETRDLQPHDHLREAKILGLLKKPCIPLLETFRDHDQHFVLAFPYMSFSLDAILQSGKALPIERLKSYFIDVFSALAHIHSMGVIHRDVKPSAILLESAEGPAYLSDFGTAWHPELSKAVEPADEKILDIGTGPYRAPEALFGNQSYGPSVDMWAAGAMLAECARDPPATLFKSRPAHEDGSQLGLILSIFKTIGTPTRETWPEAESFKTPPFDMYRVFEPKTWDNILPGLHPDILALVKKLVRYNSTRATAEQALVDIKGLEVACPTAESTPPTNDAPDPLKPAVSPASPHPLV